MIKKVCALDGLKELAEDILEFMGDCNIILLRGDLASGKTTFVQEFVKVLGLNDEVTSPTFSIQNRYKEDIYHYDIYQNGVDGFLSSGLLEELDREGFHLIEWGDEKLQKILESCFMDYIIVDIEKNSQNSRIYKVSKCTN